MGKAVPLLLFSVLLLFNGVCSVSAPPSPSPSRIVNGFFSNAFSVVMKWLMSLKTTTTRTAMTGGRSLMKFEGGYNVETVFDGSKLGIEPHTLQILPDGDLLILDCLNSNLYKISSSLSLYTRPRLIMGSVEGYLGHIDGKLRDARMNHPKGLTVDDRGNVYVADTDNMAIRKISDAGVTTIAGGKRGRGSGHVDGPSEDAKFSNDFDVVYLGSSCSLLVIDRGNKAIREIQLHFDDCAYQYGSDFPYGIAMLLSAGFFGYMLALLQRRIGLIMSSQDDGEVLKEGISSSLYQKPFKSPLSRKPLIPAEREPEKQEETFLGSLGQMVDQGGGCATEIMGGLLPAFKKNNQQSKNLRQDVFVNGWPVQESFVIPNEDEPPPPVETRAPTPKKTYAFMSKDPEKMQQLKQSRAFYSGWDVELQKQQQQQVKKHHQHHSRSHLSVPQTYYERSSEKTNVVFGAVQEQDKLLKSVVMKPLDHGNLAYDQQNLRTRFSSATIRDVENTNFCIPSAVDMRSLGIIR